MKKNIKKIFLPLKTSVPSCTNGQTQPIPITDPKEDDHHNRRYLRREFSYSKFEQALILPEDVVKEKISANASNGVLTIDLPKRTPEEKAKVNRVIEIH